MTVTKLGTDLDEFLGTELGVTGGTPEPGIEYFFFTNVKTDTPGGNIIQTGDEEDGWTCATALAWMGSDYARAGGSSLYLPSGVDGSFYAVFIDKFAFGQPSFIMATDSNYYGVNDAGVIGLYCDTNWRVFKYGAEQSVATIPFSAGDVVRFERADTVVTISISHDDGDTWLELVVVTGVADTNLWMGCTLNSDITTPILGPMWCVNGVPYP